VAFSKSLRWIFTAICLIWAGVAEAQTISIVSGNGQLVKAFFPSSAPLVVVVRDANGNPLKGVQVSWTVSGGTSGTPGILYAPQTTTDANGQATNTFIGANVTLPASFAQSTVTATYGGAHAVFTETTAGIQLSDGTILVQATVLSPSLAQLPLTGAAGQQGAIPVKIKVNAIFGLQANQGIPNISIAATPDTANNPSTIGCAGGTIYTDSSGNATCNLVFGGKIGGGNFTVNVGSWDNFNFSYKVVAGPPAAVIIKSGNQQSGSPGKTLPSPLLVEVVDLGGNDLAGVPVVFEPVVAGTATLTNVSPATDNSGRASARVTLGNTAGAIQIRARTADNAASVLFTANVNIVIAGLVKVSGDMQDTVVINTAFGTPLVVEVTDNQGNPVVGAPVSFAVTSGSAILATTSSITDSNGHASTTVTAGGTAGPIVITATSSPAPPVTFSLSSRLPGPSCDPNLAFSNGASFKANWISPGSVATITCTGLAPGIQGSVLSNEFGPLALQVAGVTVQFDGHYAPIYSVSNINGHESVNVQVPFEVTPGTVPVVINVNGGTNPPGLTAVISPAAPGIFETVMSDGLKRAVAVRPDGSFVSLENPVQRGERIRTYLTGLTPDSGTVGTNMFAPLDKDIAITSRVIVGINNAGVPVHSVTYAQDLIGVWEVQFDIPSNAPTGTNVVFSLGVPSGSGFAYTQASYIPIK
jgi:uncharacterized protein (TIGR03437 family)